MVSLQLQHCILPSIRLAFLPNTSPQGRRNGAYVKRVSAVFVRQEEQASNSPSASSSSSVSSQETRRIEANESLSFSDGIARRQLLAVGACVPAFFLFAETPVSFAAESKKNFLSVTDKKDGYTFLYPFGWQEVVIEGQDKVFKDVIEPLESASVNIVPTAKQDIRDFGPPEQVVETLIKKFLAPSTQKTKIIQAKEQVVDGKGYYTFEFVAKAPNYTRHALGVICINNGKFYTLTTGANERRWEKMKDRLFAVTDSFRLFNA